MEATDHKEKWRFSDNCNLHKDARTLQTALMSSLKIAFYKIGGILFTFFIFRQILTWFLQFFLGTSVSVWQTLWNTILDTVGDDPVSLYTYKLVIFVFCTYWFVGSIYLILDISKKPKFLHRYKIQPGTNEPVETNRLMQSCAWVLFNQVIVTSACLYMMYPAFKWRGIPPVRQLPEFHSVLAHIIILLLVEEAVFYYSHRLLHTKYLYHFIHKRHHEWTAPIAIVGIYCHPIEFVFSNFLPVVLGPFIAGSHVALAYMWYFSVLTVVLYNHSGYNFPYFPSSESHHFHHLRFNECFGSLDILDTFHGTDTKFRKSKAHSRHKILWSFQ